ncbi:pyridoxamine 5'-phosphate oxidase family protein [Phaeacidiphilus oryzae]|uniref:pyridoxamine 5'-phosphate oxidase family protein n=1 Tax=Phaeacidiphilus oryzae TaxID=348818 RepID=UPI000561F2B3|nr:pyridoxamine 5'-phosphate oxidase family protein [Phaeacidiphilus oryzae]
MTEKKPVEVRNLDDRYGSAVLEWSRAEEALALVPSPAYTQFLGTSRPDGTPHAAGIGAQWLAGEIYFTSGPAARKARDLAANPKCTISARLPGIDLVLEGTACRVTDRRTLERVAAGYQAGGWPARVEGEAFTAPFNAPSAGPPPWYVYRFDFHTVYGVATEEPFGATRWRF